MIALLFEYDTALTGITEDLESTRAQTDAAANDVESLRSDSTRIMEHLATLQDDHTRLTELVEGAESHHHALKRLDDLWADLHRDMTALAEALSRREDG